MADFLTTAKVCLSEKQDDMDQELLSTEESSEVDKLIETLFV